MTHQEKKEISGGADGVADVMVVVVSGCGDGGGAWRRLARIWPNVGGGARKEKKEERECVCAMVKMKKP
ncbi:hypothetical protein Tco_1519634 [Tanacetum coccineum]